MTPAFHRFGANACGGPAIGVLVRHPFSDGAAFPAENVRTLEGRPVIRGTVPVCGSCGRVIDSFAELSYEARTPDTFASLVREFIRRVRHGA